MVSTREHVRHSMLFLHWIWLGCIQMACAQDAGHRTMRVSLPDRSIEALVLNKRKVVSPRPDRDYFWCIGQRIMATQGGVSGDLLDGPYVEYHPNGQLMTKGWLSKGLRTGSWLEWDEKGRLLRSTSWKNGRKHGRSLIMDLAGGEPTEQRHRNGKLIEPKKEKRKLNRRDRKEQDREESPTDDKPLAKKKERPTKETKDKGMSKRMRARNEQNKGTKDEVVRKRTQEKDEKKGKPSPSVTP